MELKPWKKYGKAILFVKVVLIFHFYLLWFSCFFVLCTFSWLLCGRLSVTVPSTSLKNSSLKCQVYKLAFGHCYKIANPVLVSCNLLCTWCTIIAVIACSLSYVMYTVYCCALCQSVITSFCCYAALMSFLIVCEHGMRVKILEYKKTLKACFYIFIYQ